MKKTIFDTTFSRNYNLKTLAENAGRLIESKLSTDMTQEEYLYLINQISPIEFTPIRRVFDELRQRNKLDMAYYISTLATPNVDMPEVLTVRDVVVNGSNVSTIRTDSYKKMLVEISQCLQKPTERHGRFSVIAPAALMNTIVRASLCKSYESSDAWLSSQNVAFLAEIYARALSNEVSRIYKCDLTEHMKCMYAFAFYFAYMMTDELDENRAPKVLNRLTFLSRGGLIKLEELSTIMYGILGNSYCTMEHVAEFIRQIGPQRMKDFSPQVIYRKAFTASKNNIPTYIALDYPPYLVYLILMVGGGDKHPLLSNVLDKMGNRSFMNTSIGNILKDSDIIRG